MEQLYKIICKEENYTAIRDIDKSSGLQIIYNINNHKYKFKKWNNTDTLLFNSNKYLIFCKKDSNNGFAFLVNNQFMKNGEKYYVLDKISYKKNNINNLQKHFDIFITLQQKYNVLVNTYVNNLINNNK